MIRDKSLYKEEIVDGIEYTFVKSRDYRGNGLQRILNMVELPFQMWKTMKLFFKKEKPDVIYTSSPDLFVAFFALVFGRKKKIPVVVEVRDLWPESIVEYNGMSRKNPIIQILYQLEKWIYKKADRLIFTMPGGKEYIKDNLRLEARSRYLDEYSQADNYIDVYLGDEKIQEVPLYELDFRR